MMVVAGPPHRRTTLRRVLVGVILAILAVPVVVAGAAALLPGPAVRAGLRAAGYDLAFDDLRLGLNGLEVSGLRIGSPPDLRLDRLRIGYQPRQLWHGRLEAVEIAGLVLHGRLDDRGLQLAGLDGGGEVGGPATLPLPWPERISVQETRLELATPWGELTVPLSAELHPAGDRAAFVLGIASARLASGSGRLVTDLHLEGETTLDPATMLEAATASGTAEFVADGLAVPGLGGLDGSGEVAIALERRQLGAVLRRLDLGLKEIGPGLAGVAALMPAPWRLALRQPVGVSADLRGDEIRLEGDGRLALVSAGPQMVAAASATLTLDPGGRLRELVVADGQIDLRDLAWAGMRLDRGKVRLDGAGTAAGWQGTIDIELTGAGEPWPGLMLDAATLRHHLAASGADGRLTVAARDPGEVGAEVAWQKEARGTFSARLEAGETPLLTARFENGAVDWQAALGAAVPDVEVTATVAQKPLHAAVSAARLVADLNGQGANLGAGRVGLEGGRVAVPAYALEIDGIAGEIPLAASGLAPDRPISLAIGSIAHGGKPPWFAPLRLEAELRPAGDRLAFDARLGRPAGDAEVQLSGEHDLVTGDGRARVELPPVAFAAGRLQPGRLAPVLGDYLADVSGRVGMTGGLRWSAKGGIRADLDLLLEGLGFTAGPARFEQVNGIVRFDRVLPLATPPGQQLAVGLLDFGLPLTDGVVSFQLEPEPAVAVEALTWRFAGGQVTAEPFRIGSAAAGFTTVLEAEGLDLGQLFALIRLDGLSGEGSISGTLPVEVSRSEAMVRGGELIARKPGWLRYRPETAPTALQAGGENVSLLLAALENFRYEALRITLDGRTDAEMDIGLHITGANPDLYDGYPIEFNLNLEGELANLLRSGLASYQIPDRIGKQMRQFGR